MALRGSSRWRADEWGTPCTPDLVGMAIYAGGPRFQCDRRTRQVWTLLGGVFLRHRYIVHTAGCYNCRTITGGTSNSSHSWAISNDINESTNPYRRDRLVTDMLGPIGNDYSMIEEAYEIRTVNNVQVLRWGGDWDGRPDVPNSNYDAMHWEIIATPGELALGFVLNAPKPSSPITSFPVIRRGARGPIVLHLQEMLGMNNTTGQGTFGPRTEEAVQNYQRAHGLMADGIVGHATWTALITKQPTLAVAGIGPQK